MRSDEPTKQVSGSVISAVGYVVTVFAVVGLTFLFTRLMFIELGQYVKLIYPGYGM
jgi:hypothetical protein